MVVAIVVLHVLSCFLQDETWHGSLPSGLGRITLRMCHFRVNKILAHFGLKSVAFASQCPMLSLQSGVSLVIQIG